MTCEDFQRKIWLEEITPAMKEHMTFCSDCKGELELYQLMMEEVEQIEIPPMTRSLVPTDAFIHTAFQVRKRRKWTKASSVAAVAVLVLGIGGSMGYNAMHASPQSSPHSNPGHSNQPQSIADSGANTQKPATDSSSLDQTSSSATASPNVVTVDDVPETMPGRNMWEALRIYLQQHVSTLEVQHIHIDTFLPQMTNQQTVDDIDRTMNQSQVSAVLTVQLQNGANATQFRNGVQKVTVTMQKQNGWIVTQFQITGYQLAFENVPVSGLNETLYTWVQENKVQKGTYSTDDNGDTYILLASGKDPSEGYTMRVENVMETSDHIQIETSYYKPGSTGPAVPYAVIRIKHTNKKITWVDDGYA